MLNNQAQSETFGRRGQCRGPASWMAAHDGHSSAVGNAGAKVAAAATVSPGGLLARLLSPLASPLAWHPAQRRAPAASATTAPVTTMLTTAAS